MPVDGSGQSWAALEYAAEQFGNPTLVALYAVDPVEGAYGPELGGDVGDAE